MQDTWYILFAGESNMRGRVKGVIVRGDTYSSGRFSSCVCWKETFPNTDVRALSWLYLHSFRALSYPHALKSFLLTAMTYKVAGVMYRVMAPTGSGQRQLYSARLGEIIIVNYNLGYVSGAWHSKDVVRIRADSRFAMRRLRKNFTELVRL